MHQVRPPNRVLTRTVALLAGALALVGCGGGEARQPSANGTSVVGLVSSLPIVWPESQDISELLSQNDAEHWVLAALREQGEVRVLDSLDGADGALPLPEGALLVMAQPWPLSPQENVALDRWVREGGRLLLLADPMLTFESAYALGDRRRPQDMAMLSPILSRWGLRLLPVTDGAPLSEVVEIDGTPAPVGPRAVVPRCRSTAARRRCRCRGGVPPREPSRPRSPAGASRGP